MLTKPILNVLFSLFITFSLIPTSTFADDINSSPRVLILNSYHPQYLWAEQLTKGAISVLTQKIPDENIHVEYMDSRRFIDDDTHDKLLLKLYEHSYKRFRPDIIITADDAAFHFMLKYGDTIFPDIPVVFCGVNVFEPNWLNNHPNFTGIQEGMEIAGNLELIHQIQPEVDTIYILGDDTGLGLSMVNEAKRVKQQWQSDPEKSKIRLIIESHLSIKELYQKAAHYPKTAAMLMLAIHQDKDGTYFSYTEHLNKLSQVSSVPVYGMWGTLIIGNGGIGGMLNNPYEHGQSTAKLALQILAGQSPSTIPIGDKSLFLPYLDYEQLKRFGISTERLPENAIIINKPVSFYEKYSQLVHATSMIFTILILIISLLIIINNHRHRTQKKLKQLNDALADRNELLDHLSKLMKDEALTDSLTKIKNRRASDLDLNRFIERSLHSGETLSIALMDMDLFKNINDTWGHQKGDEVLTLSAQTIKNALRPGDYVYRWGGEEFLVLLPDTSLEEAKQACERVRIAINQQNIQPVESITLSIGIATLEENDDYDSLIGKADKAMYQAKDNGRNQICTIPPS